MTSTITRDIESTPLGTGDGRLVMPTRDGVRLTDLVDAGLDTILRSAGHLLIRGFDADADQFNEVVESYSSRITLDPARVFHGKVAQKVDSGTDSIGFHIENGATPFVPDLLWFHCIKAASAGSQTTICDGVRVWNALSDRSRELFTATPIVYRRTVPRELWQKFAAHLANDGRLAETMTLTDLYALTSDYGKAEFVENADGSLSYEFVIYAARTVRGGSTMTWANSIFGPSFNYDTPDIRFIDGNAIPDDVLAECAAVTDELTEEVQWRDGDVVLIDNSRVMHGRRPILDTDRTIINAQSYAR